ncbi:MAG: hypothetical protein KJ592_00195 [Nanoarchaeota archaeon]|nr:hypothetical protein [Nanoarchaeota archaeon]
MLNPLSKGKLLFTDKSRIEHSVKKQFVFYGRIKGKNVWFKPMNIKYYYESPERRRKIITEKYGKKFSIKGLGKVFKDNSFGGIFK